MQRKSLAFTAVALLALAACATDGPTGVQTAAESAPLLGKTNGTPETVAGARFIAGNISGDGGAVCRTLGLGGSGYKVDGANSATIAGYRFTVSGDGKYLTFAQVTPGSSIVAVLVKGGPDGFLYEYAPGEPSRTMRSPLNGGGNIPGISHYVVCFTPTPPGEWQLEKRIRGYWKSMAMGPGDFVPGSTVTFPAGCAAYANATAAGEAGCVRWIEYDVIATKIGGSASDPQVLVADDLKTACENFAVGVGFRLYCDYPDRLTLPWTTFFDGGEQTSSTRTWHYVMDLWNKSDCGGRWTLVNTASLKEPGKPTIYAPAALTVVTAPCTP